MAALQGDSAGLRVLLVKINKHDLALAFVILSTRLINGRVLGFQVFIEVDSRLEAGVFRFFEPNILNLELVPVEVTKKCDCLILS